MISIKGIIDKVASRKLGVTAAVGAAAATGAVEITWPIAAIAMAYIAGQTVVDTWGRLKRGQIEVGSIEKPPSCHGPGLSVRPLPLRFHAPTTPLP